MQIPAFSIEPLESRIALNATGWSDTVDNPYMPFKQGMHWTYAGATNGQPERNTVVVQSYTKLIKGVTCTVVLDRVYVNGQLSEKTQDFYAQDDKGNVWYFGEASREMDNGKVVSREGSWLAGVSGAKAGIIMQADPTIDGSYYQEFSPGVAEDQAQNLSLHAKAKTSFGSFRNCLETLEFSDLEKGVSEAKFYAKGIGLVKSQSLTGDEVETLKLVSFGT